MILSFSSFLFSLPPPLSFPFSPSAWLHRLGPLWLLANQRMSWKKPWTQRGCVVQQHPDPGFWNLGTPVFCVYVQVFVGVVCQCAWMEHWGMGAGRNLRGRQQDCSPRRTLKWKRRANASCQKVKSSTPKSIYLTSFTCIYLNILQQGLAGSSAVLVLWIQLDFDTVCLPVYSTLWKTSIPRINYSWYSHLSERFHVKRYSMDIFFSNSFYYIVWIKTTTGKKQK